jgi:hypothetical protein
VELKEGSKYFCFDFTLFASEDQACRMAVKLIHITITQKHGDHEHED